MTPVPAAAGGNINQTFIVGDTSLGELSVPAATPATPIAVIGGNSAIFGDDALVNGTGAFTGFGNNFSIAADLTLGRAGYGSLSASGQTRISAGDDLILGAQDGSSGRLFVNDLGTIAEAADDIIVGEGGTALVQALTGSRVFAESSTIGMNASADGTVTISGNESLWRQTGAITIGALGRGYLQIVSQARMESGAASVGLNGSGVGSANVSGTGSVWEVAGALTVAAAGEAELNITEGGRLTNTGATRLATLAGSDAEIRVTGVNSVWNAGPSITVGENGAAVMHILAGGRVFSGTTMLAVNAAGRGEVVVDGIGSVLDVSGSLDVGRVSQAEALLTLSSGAVANVSGVVRVGDAGDIFMAGGRLNSGGGVTNSGLIRGAGRINGAVTNAAIGEMRIQAGNSLVLGSTLGNAGLVQMDGGELQVLGAATNTGDMDLDNAIVRFQGELDNDAGGQIAVTGGDVDFYGVVNNALNAQIVVGAGATAKFHDAVDNDGQLFVMPGANVLMLEDLSFAPTSLVSLRLNSSSLDEGFSPLEVGGQSTLAGELRVELAGGLAPALGDVFQVLTAAEGLVGTFTTTTLPALAGGLEWDLDYESDHLSLSVVADPSVGDFDGDGDVDAADLVDWRAGFGMSTGAGRDDGDGDGDGDVDGSDFLTWQRQLGSNPGGQATAAAIPEPGSAALAVLAMIVVGGCGRRARRLS